MSIGDRSQHILKFERYFEDQDNLYMLFQYCKHKTLAELLRGQRKLIQNDVSIIIRQLVHGLLYLKNRNVAHCGIRLSCLYIDDDLKIRIGGFGEAKLKGQITNYDDSNQSLENTPPEMIQNPKNASFKADVWSVGIIAV